VDLGSGGSVQGYTDNVASVLERVPEDAAVIPGHGALTDVEGLRAFHAMLVETTEIVRQRIEDGMTLEETREAGLPGEWESWGEGFISTPRWLETIYRSLSEVSP
jgi:glyoxylase-like metal-dependent hydrolase (beta-lactamase superfamily II)